MDGIDLNELPFDLNNANNDEEFVEVIDESPDPEFIANLDNPEADVAGAMGTGLPSGNGNEDGINPNDQPELLYNLEEPYVGMKFDSLPHARRHYNDYACRTRFSIKANTNRRNVITKELEKQQFVCNKYKKPTADEVPLEKLLNNYSADEGTDSGDKNGEDDDSRSCSKCSGSSRSGKSGQKRKKREVVKQTHCRARMVVKLNGKWEVIHYIGGHNHPMVVRPDKKSI
jgi:hypothetical protein